MRARAELAANAVSYAAEAVSRPGALQRIVTAMGAEEEISLIVVVGGRPARVLATTRIAWLGKALTDIPAKEVVESLERAIQTRQSQDRIYMERAEFDFASPLLLSQLELADRSLLTDGTIMVRLDVGATQAAMRQLTGEFSAAFLAALVILATLGYGMIHHLVLLPISRIGTLVEHRREGMHESWAEAATDDEIGALARTLNDSLTRTDAALQELEDEKSSLQAIMNNVPYLMWLKDPAGRFLAVNDLFARSCGRQRAEEVVGKTDLDIWPADLANKYRLDDAEVMATRQQKKVEEPVVDQGHITWVETFKTTILNANGHVIGTTGVAQDITERKLVEAERERLIAELQAALADVKTLSGILPICAWCKKVRDDAGYWHQVEVYVRDHSTAEFSHGICPACRGSVRGDTT
jgi:PAS domain S-box-containing protein